MESSGKGSTVCVTGGTGYLASWLIMKLLDRGYTVNTTVRFSPETKRDITFLTDLPGASERLRIFHNADLDKPESFRDAIEGCTGVFHVSHPMVFHNEETEEETIKKSINGAIGILQSSVDSKTVKRVVYTSSIASVLYPKNQDKMVDENSWSDVDYIKKSNVSYGSSYLICKTLTEKACLEFGETHGLDVVSVLPSWVSGPFITPTLPGSVRTLMVMIFGKEDNFVSSVLPFVHVDDVIRAHIFVYENPEAKGRYICSAREITVYELAEFLSARYPEYQIPSPDSLKKIERKKWPSVSSKKLLESGGFNKFNYGLEEIFDDAIRCCKQKSLL